MTILNFHLRNLSCNAAKIRKLKFFVARQVVKKGVTRAIASSSCLAKTLLSVALQVSRRNYFV